MKPGSRKAGVVWHTQGSGKSITMACYVGNESAVRELGDDILKKIAIEITEKLRASTTVDWQA